MNIICVGANGSYHLSNTKRNILQVDFNNLHFNFSNGYSQKNINLFYVKKFQTFKDIFSDSY